MVAKFSEKLSGQNSYKLITRPYNVTFKNKLDSIVTAMRT